VRQSVKSYNKRWSSSFSTLEIEEDEVTKIKILSCARQNGLICIGAREERRRRGLEMKVPIYAYALVPRFCD
jgi:hypothetical protein